MGWDANRPTTEDTIANVPSIVQDNFGALQNAMSAEHAGIGDTSSVSGQHLSGGPGWVYQGTTTSIGLLSNPGSGALAYDTTLGTLKRYWSSSWNPVTSAKWSRSRWYLSNNVAMSSVDGDTQTVSLSWDGKSYDTLSEYVSTTGEWTAQSDGYYLVIGSLTLNNSGTRGTTLVTGCSAMSGITANWGLQPISTMSAVPTGCQLSAQWGGYPTANDPVGAVDDWAPGTDYAYCYYSTYPIDYNLQVSQSALASATGICSVYVSASVAGYWTAARFRLARGNTWYVGDPSLNGAYATPTWFSYEWTTDPSTSSAWTSAGVLACTGITMCGAGYSIYPGYLYAARLVVTHGGSANYVSIMEYPTADDAYYLEMSAGAANYGQPDIYWFTSPVTNPLSVQTQNIKVNVRGRLKSSTANAITACSVIRVGTTNYSGSTTPSDGNHVLSSTSFANYDWVYATNPATLAAWDHTEVKGTAASNKLCGFGMALVSSSPTTTSADMSQCYMTVSWEYVEPYAKLNLRKTPVGGAVSTIRSVVQKLPEVGSSTEETVRLVEMLPLSAGDKLGFTLTRTCNDDTVISGEGVSYMAIHRLGGNWL